MSSSRGRARGAACGPHRPEPPALSTAIRVAGAHFALRPGALKDGGSRTHGDMSPGAPSSTALFDLSSSSDPERKFSYSGCGATFPSPPPSVTALYSIARRSPGAELRGAPLSVNPRGYQTATQQQLLRLKFPVPRAGTRRRACAGDWRARMGPLPCLSPRTLPPRARFATRLPGGRGWFEGRACAGGGGASRASIFCFALRRCG
jgi:hypothetical protein